MLFFRNFGFGLQQSKIYQATFSCLHRYTRRPICAIPCDEVDDLCLNYDDEKVCRQSRELLIIPLIISLVIIGCILGKMTYSLHFDKTAISEHELDHINEFVEKLCHKEDVSFENIHVDGLVQKLVLHLDANFKSNELVMMYQDIYMLEVAFHSDDIKNAEKCLKEG